MSRKSEALRLSAGRNAAESMGDGVAPGEPAAVSPRNDGRDPSWDIARCRQTHEVPLSMIDPDPDQPRKDFDPGALADLAGSMAKRGLLQAIRARRDPVSGRHVIVAGERRFRAAMLLGWRTIRAHVVEPGAERLAILLDQLAENTVRDDLKPIELARSYRAILDETGWSYDQLAEASGVSKATVGRTMRLLRLEPEIQEQVDAGAIPATTAYEMTKIADPGERKVVAEEVASGRLRREDVPSPRKPRRATDRKTIELPNGNKAIIEGPDADAIAAEAPLLRRAVERILEGHQQDAA